MPIVTSDQGKAFIQTCLMTPDDSAVSDAIPSPKKQRLDVNKDVVNEGHRQDADKTTYISVTSSQDPGLLRNWPSLQVIYVIFLV